MRSKKLVSLVDMLDKSIQGHREVKFKEIVDVMEGRGFGALLVFPALLTILPTGAIPGVPVCSAAMICLISGQLVLGKKHPWIPGPLAKFSMSKKKLEAALKKARPLAEAIDQFAHPRYEFLVKKSMQRCVAFLCMALAVIMAVIGFIPYVPALFSIPILLFAVGLSVRDGLLTMIGLACSLAAVLAVPFLFKII